jgi:hypothetical protein
MKRFYLALTALLLLSACAPLQEKAELIEVGNPPLTAIAYPASVRGAYLIPAGTNMKFCAEPAPDTALDSLQKLAAEVTAKVPQGPEGSAKFNSELQAKVVELAGRSELVLIAREMFYRACELMVNNPGQEEKAAELYKSAQEVIVALAQAERNRSVAIAARELEAAGVGKSVLEEYLKASPPQQ